MPLNHPEADLTQIDQLLRDQAAAARRLSPPDLHARVIEQLRTAPAASNRSRWPYLIALPASLAAAAAFAWLLTPTPAPRPTTPSLALRVPLNPAPVIRPASLFVEDSVDRPLRNEATLLVRDTKRATRVVVDCLPFASRGG
jgi:hypothetical protein